MVPAGGRQSATLVLVRRRARGAAWAALVLLLVGLLLPAWVVVPLVLVAGAWCLRTEPRGLCLPPERPPIKTCVNGGPSPSPHSLLMGSYLGHSETTGASVRGQQLRLREALHRPNPAVPTPQRRLTYGEPPSMSRFTLTRRRYPVQQTQYALLGSLPTVRWDGYQRKNVLTAKNSAVPHSPVTVKIAPLDRIAHSPIFQQLASPAHSSTANIAPDPCARETVLNALKASRKRVVEDDCCTSLDGQDNKRRRNDSNGSGHSAFESLLANGSPASLIPKPGILKRSQNTQCNDENLSKRSRTSSISSVNHSCMAGFPTSVRNAITSSYSSSRGIAKTPRRGPSASPLSSLSSSRSLTPERPTKKTREDALQHSKASTPRSEGKEHQTGKDLAIPVQKPNSGNTLTSPSSSDGKRKRKMQLLTLRRTDPLNLLPPPQLGYSVTVEDLDAEKRAALEYINKALEEESSAPSASTTTETAASMPSLSFTLATSVTSLPVTITNTLLDSPKEVQKPTAVTDPASVSATIMEPSNPLASSASITSSSFTMTPSNSKLLSTWGVASPNLTQALTSPMQSTIAPSQTAVSVPTVSSQSIVGELPKSSSLMSILLAKPIEDPPSTSTVCSTSTPTFKPVFGEKVDSPMSPPVSTAAQSITTTVAFKPIFGTLATPATMSATSASPFSFGQSTGTAATSAPAPIQTASSSIFTALAQTSSATTATLASTTGTLTDTATKPSFAFGLQAPASIPSSTISGTHSSTTAPSFQFGVAALNTTMPSTVGFGANSMFQFSKPAAATVTVSAASAQPVVSTFGQALPSSTPASSSFVFGSTPATAPTTAGTSQPTMTFGSSASFFSSGSSSFNMSTNPYPNSSGQTGQPSTALTGITFGSTPSPFNFGSSSQAAVQPTFASGTQPAFGASAPVSFGIAANTQPIFGGAKPVLSMGPSTTAAASAFGSGVAQTTSGSMFGSGTPNQFGFSAVSQSGNSSSSFGLGTQSSNVSPALSGFSFGSGQSAAATNTSAFGSPAMTQNVLSTPGQAPSFAFGTANSSNSVTFGGTSTPTFGQSSAAAGSSLSFGTPATPAMGFSTPGPSFGSPAPAFSIGAGSRPSGTRQRLQARRQHTRKK